MDRLPLELFTLIFDYLPPIYLYRLRTVSRAWNYKLSSSHMVERTVKRAGLDPSDLEAEQMMRNHMICRPAKQFTWDFDLPWNSEFQHNATLCGDLVMCTAEIGTYNEELQICVVDLKKKQENTITIFVDEHEYAWYFFSEEMIAVLLQKNGKFEMRWMDVQLGPVTTVEFPDMLDGQCISTYGLTMAGVVDDRVWIYDAKTNQHQYLLEHTRPHEQSSNTVLVLDESITLWYMLACEELVVRRYTKDGALLFERMLPVSMMGTISVEHAGGSLYRVQGWEDTLKVTENATVDLETGIVELDPLDSKYAECWRGRWFAVEREMVTIKDGMKHCLAWDGRTPSSLQMNDRWLIQTIMPDHLTFGVHILDFQGKAKLERRIVRDDGHESIDWTWRRV